MVDDCELCRFKSRCALCPKEAKDKTAIKWSAWTEVESEEGTKKKYVVWEVKDQEPVTATHLFAKAQNISDVLCGGGRVGCGTWSQRGFSTRPDGNC